MSLVDVIRDFAPFAPVVSALASTGALALATITLWYLKRDHESKYRPYVWGAIHVEPFSDKAGFFVTVLPKNIGSHPCKVKVSGITLTIGDEVHTTPDQNGWVLLAPTGMVLQLPAGNVNETGVQNIREARYKSNRIEIKFRIDASSVDDRFKLAKIFAYEIDVRGDKPVDLFRADWVQDA